MAKFSVDTQRLAEALRNLSSSQRDAGQRALNEEVTAIDTESAKAREQEKLKTLIIRNKILEANARHREKYARNIFTLTCIWIFLIFLILIARGLYDYTCFYLSNSVLIALITSTTINFFGFFFLVVRYLFHVEMKKEKIQSNK